MHGLYWLVANLAARQPLVLAVDDAHWADAPSLRWLAHLAARVEHLPVALLLAVRDGPDEPELLGELRAAGTRIRLGPLGPDATAALVRRRLAGATRSCAASATPAPAGTRSCSRRWPPRCGTATRRRSRSRRRCCGGSGPRARGQAAGPRAGGPRRARAAASGRRAGGTGPARRGAAGRPAARGRRAGARLGARVRPSHRADRRLRVDPAGRAGPGPRRSGPAAGTRRGRRRTPRAAPAAQRAGRRPAGGGAAARGRRRGQRTRRPGRGRGLPAPRAGRAAGPPRTGRACCSSWGSRWPASAAPRPGRPCGRRSSWPARARPALLAARVLGIWAYHAEAAAICRDALAGPVTRTRRLADSLEAELFQNAVISAASRGGRRWPGRACDRPVGRLGGQRRAAGRGARGRLDALTRARPDAHPARFPHRGVRAAGAHLGGRARARPGGSATRCSRTPGGAAR